MSSALSAGAGVATIASEVAAGHVTALAVAQATFARITAGNPRLNAFTDVLTERVLSKARRIDADRAAGREPGPLAGVPFGVKNLFDIAGLPTRAGSRINRDRAPAKRDAALARRLEAAGAMLIGGLNMGEYAYDFTGENAHDGPSRNPHDLSRMTGGSSGGSGAALAGGLVPLTLGSDTNGSIRVPSAFCGTFGLKPTYGRLSRAGSFPFVGSLDHLGPFARSVEDLALSYDAMQGADPDDPASAGRPAEPVMPHLRQGADGLRIAVLGGYFARQAEPAVLAAVSLAARALGTERVLELPEAHRARAAAFVMTAAEGAALHAARLRERAADFDPAVRDRLIGGLAIPANWVQQAQRFRRWYQERVLALFDGVDVLLAPSTPCRAPRLGQTELTLDGVIMPLRPNIGIFTQPISFIGLPVVAVPIWMDKDLPFGLQVIAPPWREDLALRVAFSLADAGIATSPLGKGLAFARGLSW
ncbi:Amidase (plasmid) [Roseomonas mucosa]|uniref:Amidase n=1 Tax=Roseomonas mucosa TaxID=207340 RepID=A0A4Y1MRH3_9PROT|nr:AtzE family amidohydrolase [Roseomonas mucosa]AWV20581.1 Amidase [Roseomonas mucosa]MDT8278308.1 AtzE family amidohydrolase [Roseomonas mucosa]MDT8356542.1 AtzE family amidohydrolase [Roseomonas mucosa]